MRSGRGENGKPVFGPASGSFSGHGEAHMQARHAARSDAIWCDLPRSDMMRAAVEALHRGQPSVRIAGHGGLCCMMQCDVL